MSWDANPPMGNSKKGNDLFLKLKDGESVKIIIKGEPYTFYSKFENGKSFIVDQTLEGAKFRFRINVIVNDNGKYVAKIMEHGARMFYALKDLKQDYKFSDTILKLTRNGLGTDTIYSIIPMPGGIDQKTKDNISTIKLHELSLKPSKPQSDDLNAFLDAPTPDWERQDPREDVPF